MFIVANRGVKGQDEIIDRFKKPTNEPRITHDSMTAYGDTWILKEARVAAGVADSKKVAEAIRKLPVAFARHGRAWPGHPRLYWSLLPSRGRPGQARA